MTRTSSCLRCNTYLQPNGKLKGKNIHYPIMNADKVICGIVEYNKELFPFTYPFYAF